MVSSNSHSTVVNTPDYQAHFTYGPRVSACACRELTKTRKEYKAMVTRMKLKGNTVRVESYNHVQWVLKISANSMYRALSFGQYNTYSPSSGMSVTSIWMWYLNITAVVITCLGFNALYGDTDSIMFYLPGTKSSHTLP